MDIKNYSEEEMSRLHAEVSAELEKIPGVAAVGFGAKEKGGEITGEVAFRVYVTEKKTKADLQPGEVIPEKIRGFKTDVLPVIESKPLACEDVDIHNTVIGGISIVSNLDKFLQSGSPLPDKAVGTLGCLATINGNTSKENIALLSNRHVLLAGGAKKGDTVFQPKIASGPKPFNKDTIHPIATILDEGLEGDHSYKYPGEPAAAAYYIDCASAKVAVNYSTCCDKNKGIEFKNEIRDLNINGNSAISGVARITYKDIFQTDAGGNVILNPDGTPKLNQYKVFKCGRTTGKTIGIVIEVGATHSRNGVTLGQNIIVVMPTGPNCMGNMIFIAAGDSGSVLVNEKNEVVGLLFGETSSAPHRGLASHIHPVLDRLRITLLAKPAGTSSQQRNAIDVTDPETIRKKEEHLARLQRLKSEYLQSERGREWYLLFETHRPEVLQLIHQKRGVTVAWHRHHGPGFVASFVKNFDDPSCKVPLEIKGVSLQMLMEKMRDSLYENGSKKLKTAVERYAGELIEAASGCTDFQTLLSNICYRQTV